MCLHGKEKQEYGECKRTNVSPLTSVVTEYHTSHVGLRAMMQNSLCSTYDVVLKLTCFS